MAVPTGCRIAFSFTASFLAGCTIVCAICKLPRVTCVGHVIVALLTTGLAGVSTYSAVSHSPVDRATISMLCAAIGTSTLFKFETLNKLGVLCVLSLCVPTYTSKCITSEYIFIRMLACLQIKIVVITFVRMLACLQFGMVVMLAKGYRTQVGSSILLLSVALEYALLGIIVLFLRSCAVERGRSSFRHVVRQLYSSFKGIVQQLHFWSMTLASLVCSILGFSFEDMGLINWSLWALILLDLILESLLSAYETVRQIAHGGLRRRGPSSCVPTPSRGALVQSPDDGEELGSLGCQNDLEDQVWWKAHAIDSPPISASDIGHNAHESEDSFANDTQQRPAEAAFGLSTGPVDRIKTTLHEQTPESLGAERGNPDND